jgi:hemerythrin
MIDHPEDHCMTGLEEIDREHLTLLKEINRAIDGCSQEKFDIIGEILGLSKLAKTHFAHEERLMLEYDYPEFIDHTQRHAIFVREFNFYIKRLLMGRGECTREDLIFFKRWFVSHIKANDCELGLFVIQKKMQAPGDREGLPLPPESHAHC